MCATLEFLRPFASTINLDGVNTDREQVQDIAYDGDTADRKHRRNHMTKLDELFPAPDKPR